jgi:SulP family sulfate permease
VEGSLFFGAAEVFRDQIRRVCEDPNLKIVILKMRNATYLDATGVMAMEELVHYMNERDRFLLVSECKKEHIRIFKNSGLLNVLNRKNVFPDNQQNSTRSTANALKRAQEILGAGEDAKISIFVGSRK